MSLLSSNGGTVGLDTNVLLRAVLGDDASQSEQARAALRELSPRRPGFITFVTLAELYWVLFKTKGIARTEVLAAIRRIVETESFMFEDDEGAIRALELAEDGADFADALIHVTFEQFVIGEVVTFDRSAARRLGWTLLDKA